MPFAEACQSFRSYTTISAASVSIDHDGLDWDESELNHSLRAKVLSAYSKGIARIVWLYLLYLFIFLLKSPVLKKGSSQD